MSVDIPALESTGDQLRAKETVAKRLSGNLGVYAIVFMVVAGAAPLSVVAGLMPLGFSMGNGLGFPVMFMIAAVILTLFSVGLSQMARVVPQPGAFYTYIRHGLGDVAGTAAAFVAVVAYICGPICTAGYIGAQFNLALQNAGGPAIPWWIYSAAIVVVIGVLGYRNIDLTSRVLAVVLIGEILIVLALAVVVLVTGGATGLTAEPFTASAIFSGNLGLGIMFATSGFIGFEATAVFRDEARNPEKTIPRATYVAVIGVGVFYAFAAYALIVAWGPDAVVQQSTDDPAGMMVTTTNTYLGVVGEIIAQVLLLTSVLACTLAFHNVVARYIHSMAGHGMLPQRFGVVHPRHGSPHLGSLVMSTIAMAVLGICALIQLDPVTQIYAWFASIVTVGVMLLMVMTSVAVPVYFYRNRIKANFWKIWVAPLLGMCGLLLAGGLILANFPMLVGGSATLAYSLLGAFPVAAVVGAGVGWNRRRTRRFESVVTD